MRCGASFCYQGNAEGVFDVTLTYLLDFWRHIFTMKNYTGAKKGKFNYYLLPVLFIMGILPFLIHVKSYETHLEDLSFFAQSTNADVFLYYKANAFIIVCSIMLVLTVIKALTNKKEIRVLKLFIPLAAYASLSLLSALFSKYSQFSFSGIFEQFESVWVLLGYALTVYYCFLFISTADDVNIIMWVLTVSTVLMLVLGLSQLFSKDILRTDFGRWLMLSSEAYKDPEAQIQFTFPLGKVYLTLYNPNYVGTYVVLISPVFLMLAFAKKKIWFIIMNLVIYVGLIICMLGSESRAGLIAVACSLILLIVIFNKKLLKFLPQAIIVFILLVGSVYTYNNYTNGKLTSKLKQALTMEETIHPLERIETTDNGILITYNSNTLKVAHILDDEAGYLNFDFNDGDDLPVSFDVTPNEDDGTLSIAINDSRFSNISILFFIYEGIPQYKITIDGTEWNFAYVNDTYYYINDKGRLDKPNNAERTSLLSKYGNSFSNRGFLWAYTIPLLKDNIILGSGPDTFMIVFPNNDYVSLKNSGNFADQIITKPHNMYLQTAVQTGVLSLICFLVFYFWYFVYSIKVFKKADKSNYITMVGIGILAGTFGYMVVGIINDSMIVTAPLFWALIGIGLAIDFIIKRDKIFAVKEEELPENGQPVKNNRVKSKSSRK